MKRILLSILALVVLVGMLFIGCAKQSSTGGGATITATKTATVTATVTAAPTTKPVAVTTIKFGDYMTAGHAARVCELIQQSCEQISDGRLQFEMMPGDTVVPLDGHQAATQQGVFDLSLETEIYFKTKFPVLALFGDVFMLDSARDYYKLEQMGGWGDLSERLYNTVNIHFLGRYARTSSGIVSKVPIEHVAALKGLKIRSVSPYADALSSLGAKTVNVTSADLFSALSSGLVDAAQYSDVATNYSMGFYEVAKYCILPNLSTAATSALLANLDFWNGLSKGDQIMLDNTYHWATEIAIHEIDYKSLTSLSLIQSQLGVTVNTWDASDWQQWKNALTGTLTPHPDDPYWVEAIDFLKEFMNTMGMEPLNLK